MKRVLLTGGAGFLGSYWLSEISSTFETHATIRNHSGHLDNIHYHSCDLADESTIKDLIRNLEPMLVIHTAALADVDQCEKNPTAAFLQNVTATKNIVHALKGSSSKLIHISTDQLFNGQKKFHKEDDPLTPVNEYGKTKALAEEEALKHSSAIVCRTNFYGKSTAQKPSFYDWCRQSLQEEKNISLYENLFYTPIYISDLVSTSMFLSQHDQRGVFNIVGSERVSKAEFGKKVADSLKLGMRNVKIEKFSQPEGEALRPLEMSLDNSKVLKYYPFPFLSITESLLKLVQ